MSNVVISGSGLYTPPHLVKNDALVKAFNASVDAFNLEHAAEIEQGILEARAHSSAEFIEKASGIKQRYLMNGSHVLDPAVMCPQLPHRDNEELSIQCEMAIGAAQEALQQAGKTAAEIDAVIVACSNMERPYPAMAIEIQAALGTTGFAYDMNVACSSATFGIQAASNAIQAGNAKAVLVISPEICSAQLNFRDRESHFIFGDACTALVLEAEETAVPGQGFLILGSKLVTQFSNNIRNNFGFLNRTQKTPTEINPADKTDKLFVQKGRKVFKEVVPMVARIIEDSLSELSIQPDDVSRFWLHQANLSMNQLIIKKLLGADFSATRAPIILDQYANTSSAGSVIAFHLFKEDMPANSTGLICSFGAGYSVGSVVLAKR